MQMSYQNYGLLFHVCIDMRLGPTMLFFPTWVVIYKVKAIMRTQMHKHFKAQCMIINDSDACKHLIAFSRTAQTAQCFSQLLEAFRLGVSLCCHFRHWPCCKLPHHFG